jgi:tetratricopeptide (TPR) repeat protein
MQTTLISRLALLACLGVAACTRARPPILPTPSPEEAKAQAAAEEIEVGRVLSAIDQHDTANDWSAATCASTRQDLLKLASKADASKAISAQYDAALVALRCGDAKTAQRELEALLTRAPDHVATKARLAVLRAQDLAPDAAIALLKRTVVETRFQDVGVLIALGTRERERGALEEARADLERALAVDDRSMQAFDQLALVQLELARRAGHDGASLQALELGVLLCSQAIAKNPAYAPLFNTLGLLHVERKDPTAAVAAFDKARAIDPTLFEAHMNAAAVNLTFRGFSGAEKAYRDALALRPKDYDARVGLALALRGQITADDPARLDAAEKELEAARAESPARPEAHYNLAILVERFRADGGSPTELSRAKRLFEEFLAKSAGRADLEVYVARAKEHLGDIDRLARFKAGS